MMWEVYPRLAWTGIRNSRKLYLPYMFTCIGMVAMYYIINSLASSPAVLAMRGGDTISTMLGLGTTVMVIFSVIFLFYTNSFLLRRRRREFGLYNVLGLSKRHIAVILLWETAITSAIALTAGLASGWLLSKAAELILVTLTRGDITYSLSVAVPTIRRAVEIYGVIFLLIYLNALRGVHTANPVALLRSENVGEKPPRANWLLGLLGALLLIAAYAIAVSIKEPLSALIWFFGAVILVIIGTYMLFISGSVLLCRVLQKRRRYYYQKRHFVSVSSMAYRMKRNGAGLASICILITMVLVMMTGSMGLYFGVEDVIRVRCPRQIITELTADDLSGVSDDAIVEWRAVVDESRAAFGATEKNVLEYRYAAISGLLRGGTVTLDSQSVEGSLLLSYGEVVTVNFVPLTDYCRITGQSVTLAPGQALVRPIRCHYDGSALTVGETSFAITGKAENLPLSSGSAYPVLLVILPDFAGDLRPFSTLADYNGDAMLRLNWYYAFDTNLAEEQHGLLADRIGNAFFDRMDAGEAPTLSGIRFESTVNERIEYFAIVGSILFLGLMLSVVFLLTTVLIIYYKQVTEGYEDQARFGIMQKVGMTKADIRRSINGQMLTVFALPMLFAALHTAFAFPMIRNLLTLFYLTNLPLLLLTAGGTVLVFAALYAIVYRVTSNAYYAIVSESA